MTQARNILVVASLVVAFLTLAGWLAFTRTRPPKSGSEAVTRAIEFQKWGQYDKAVHVLQTWMAGTSRNTSHDGFLYGQIAMIYVVKAYKKPATRDASIREAELNLEKWLDSTNEKNDAAVSLDLDGIGGVYEALGDLSDKDKCRFYEKARLAVLRQLPLIKGDSITASGTTLPLEPVRVVVKKHLDRVNDKCSKAGCQVRQEQLLR